MLAARLKGKKSPIKSAPFSGSSPASAISRLRSALCGRDITARKRGDRSGVRMRFGGCGAYCTGAGIDAGGSLPATTLRRPAIGYFQQPRVYGREETLSGLRL